MKNIFFITCVVTTTLFAIDVSASKDLSIEQLLSQILKIHPNIRSADTALKASGYALESAKWGYFPIPSVQAEQQGGKRSLIARIEQPIWAGGKIDANANIAKSQQKEAEQTLEETKYALIEKCIDTIASAARFAYIAKVHEKALLRLEGYRTTIKRRIDGGVSSDSDRQLIEARISQTKNDLRNALTSKQIAVEQLSILAGRNMSEVEIPIDLSISVPKVGYSDILDGAHKTYPKILKANVKLQTARYNLDKVYSAAHPTVSIKAEKQIEALSHGYENNGGKIYVSVQMSTGAGFSILSQIQEAKLKTIEAEHLYEYEKMEIDEKIANNYTSAVSIKSRLDTAKDSIEYANRVLESYTRLFLAGKRNWLDVANAAREVTQNELEFYDTSVSGFIHDKRLSLYSGTLIKNIGLIQ